MTTTVKQPEKVLVTDPNPAQAVKKEKRRRPPPVPPTLRRVGSKGESPQAKRQAALVLEVLGGLRTPTDAAQALGVSLPRYYVLEGRALEGLLQALEPRARGPRRSAERECERLRRTLERAERSRLRAEALLRVQGRALGIRAPETPKAKEPGKRRKRRPTARALRAAAVLRAGGLEGAGGKEDDAQAVKV